MDQNKTIDLLYDLIDEACMIIHEETNLNYIESFCRVSNDITNNFDDSRISDEAVSSLENIYTKINNLSFLNEEMRLALELIIIKGLKHNNYPPQLMTPDSISFIFGFLVEKLMDKEFRIIDVNLGTANLLNAISNFVSKEATLVGIEKDETLVKLAIASSNLINNEVKIYFNDCLMENYEISDIVIGDLDNLKQDGNYFPYLVVNKFLNNLTDDGFFIYLVDNDFFNQDGIKKFKEEFDGTFCGLIVLPNTMFNKGHVGKSVLIGTKKKLENVNMLVLRFPSLELTKEVKMTINEIDEWIKKLKGMII